MLAIYPPDRERVEKAALQALVSGEVLDVPPQPAPRRTWYRFIATDGGWGRAKLSQFCSVYDIVRETRLLSKVLPTNPRTESHAISKHNYIELLYQR